MKPLEIEKLGAILTTTPPALKPSPLVRYVAIVTNR